MFCVITGVSISKMQYFKNRLVQGLVLAPVLFNPYISHTCHVQNQQNHRGSCQYLIKRLVCTEIPNSFLTGD